jgi:hypothetical protein
MLRFHSTALIVAAIGVLAGPTQGQTPMAESLPSPPVVAPSAPVAPPTETVPPTTTTIESPISAIIEPPLSEGREVRREERGGEGDEIETDRDSFTPALTTVGRGRLVVESAYSFIENRRVNETHSFPELLFRYGITERIELRFGWNCEIGGAPGDISSGEGSEFASGKSETETNVAYGIKFALTRQDRLLPMTALIIQAATPTSGEDPATQLFVTYGAGWGFFEDWKFDTAVRFVEASDRGDRFNVWAPSAVLKVPIGESWNAHIEYFGGYSVNKAEAFNRHYVSPGLHYLITPNLEVGARLGWGLSDDSAKFFSNVGFGWRF